MVRYLAGVASALLLVSAGFLLWTSRAGQENPIPPVPKDAPAASQGAALAEPPAAAETTREQRRFARYDGNEDGTITRAEMMDTRRKPFQKLDTDHNGQLSFDEWAVTTAQRFAKADGDRSGTLTASEFATTKRPATAATRRCACPEPSGAD